MKNYANKMSAQQTSPIAWDTEHKKKQPVAVKSVKGQEATKAGVWK